jgi:hypothetical protein
VSRLSRRCGSLDLSHPYGPSQPVTGIGLLTFFTFTYSVYLNNPVSPVFYDPLLGLFEEFMKKTTEVLE